MNFIIEPTLRFKGMPGEQWTMFFKDPSGNNLEVGGCKRVLVLGWRRGCDLITKAHTSSPPSPYSSSPRRPPFPLSIVYDAFSRLCCDPRCQFKAMSHPENLFIKYNVAEG